MSLSHRKLSDVCLLILIAVELIIHVGCKDRSKSGVADITKGQNHDYLSNIGEWLGPLGNFRNGHSAETNWHQNWFNVEPELLWKHELGLGVAGVTCHKGLVYCVGNASDEEVVQCINSVTGQIVWKYSYPCSIDKRMFEGGSASTPVIDKLRGSLYVLSHEGELRSLDLTDGKELWKVSYLEKLKGKRPTWGYSSSPLLCANMLIIVPGGSGSGVAALDPLTGKMKWSFGNDEAAYSSPVQINGEGGENVMLFNSYGLSIINPQVGELLAKVRWKTEYDVNAALPLYISGHVFVCSGYGKGGGMFRLNENKLDLIYETKDTVCQFQSPIESGGNAYMVIGDNSTKAKLACMSLENGSIKWTQPLSGNRGNIITADGKLIVVSERGEVVLCDASEKGFNEYGRFQALGGRCWAPPSFADSKLYIRNNSGRLVCYDLKNKK
jgi:outer membrane protein assembly factor BamB